MTERAPGVSYTSAKGSRDALAMADTLEQQTAKCKKRIAIIEMLIEEQRAAGLSTQEAERVLSLERSFLKILDDLTKAGQNP
jgi:hypothetical protein